MPKGRENFVPLMTGWRIVLWYTGVKYGRSGRDTELPPKCGCYQQRLANRLASGGEPHNRRCGELTRGGAACKAAFFAVQASRVNL